MKSIKILLFSLFILHTMFATGCSNDVSNVEQYIEVREHIYPDTNEYKNMNEISNNKQVRQVREILNEAEWEEKVVDMPRFADFRFTFQFKDSDIEAKSVLYQLWISPSLKTVEIVKGQSEYTHLNEKNSAILYEGLTGEKLSELE
ncbi:hypothetical protein LCM10_04655 [Rossellomorea aquimaris]|uniref:hypothetical protein n=1 Tax=Rossellomorea aquimaris TaxID=189382 RepID=UPI001CD6B933|nr:hypothetical protein [Rossellomorea aquimaris]MCA1054269.1 hypothetical protein [Rossellomorea aquimaris]